MLFSGEANNDIGPANWQSDHCLAFTRIFLFQFADLDGMSGLIYPSQLNRVIASFKRMRVVVLPCVKYVLQFGLHFNRFN